MKRLAILAPMLLACGGALAPPRRAVVVVPAASAPPALAVQDSVAPDPPPTCERDPTPYATPTKEPPPIELVELEQWIAGRGASWVYAGSVADVFGDSRGRKGQFTLYADEAKWFAKKLEMDVVERYASSDWSTVAIVREAEMFERLRDSLAPLTVYDGPPPVPSGMIQLFTPQQAAVLAQLQPSGGALSSKTDPLTDAIRDFFERKKKKELDAVDGVVVKLYFRAARSGSRDNPVTARAIRRLADYEARLGAKAIAEYVDGYDPGMFLEACAALGS